MESNALCYIWLSCSAVVAATRRNKRETQEGAGLALAKQFEAQGLKMLSEHAQFEDERNVSLEAGLMMMLDRMQTGKLKIFSDLRDLFDEIRFTTGRTAA